MENAVNVVVIGSINMDLTVTTERVPGIGETVLGKEFATYPGGKGANQAIAAARLGANVHMIGAVGEDGFGKDLLQNLKKEGIDTSGVKVKKDYSTGTATIILSEHDNRIIVAPGANASVTPLEVDKYQTIIKNSDIILVQLEIPIETVQYVAKLAQKFSIPIIINPAPYQDLPKDVLKAAKYLTPNEIEVKEMERHIPSEELKNKLIITKGSSGTSYFENEKERIIPAYDVKVLDTTGAGDTFNGALAVELGKGSTKEEAVQFANAAAALSITKVGAQTGMPSREQVMEFLKR